MSLLFWPGQAQRPALPIRAGPAPAPPARAGPAPRSSGPGKPSTPLLFRPGQAQPGLIWVGNLFEFFVWQSIIVGPGR
jgi:hypothetical protein